MKDAIDIIAQPEVVTASVKGQIVIPQSIRKHIGLHAGDRLQVDVDAETGEIRLKKLGKRTNWLEALMSAPGELDLPVRRRQFYQAKQL